MLRTMTGAAFIKMHGLGNDFVVLDARARPLRLDNAQVRAIADHEHIPDVAAAELAAYLLHTPGGTAKLKHMIVDDIRDAQQAGDRDAMLKYMAVLKHFVEHHPS